MLVIIVRKDLISRLNHTILNKSQKFNIYTKLKKSTLKIYYVNEKELKFYIQQNEVYPDESFRILPPYYKDDKNISVLKDGYRIY